MVSVQRALQSNLRVMVTVKGFMGYRFFSRVLLVLGISCATAFGQFISVGVKAGIPINEAFSNSGDSSSGLPLALNSTTNRYIVGPQVELRLPFHLGVEADALYRHYAVNGRGSSEWDFPILLKYHFKGIPLIHPFADAGPTFNHVSNIGLVTLNRSSAGFVIGAGLDFHALIFHLSPEVRYVRWADQNYNYGTLNSLLSSNQNQVQFLVGFTF